MSEAFDEDPSLLGWTKTGIHFTASQRTWSYLFTLDPTPLGGNGAADADVREAREERAQRGQKLIRSFSIAKGW